MDEHVKMKPLAFYIHLKNKTLKGLGVGLNDRAEAWVQHLVAGGGGGSRTEV